MTHAICCAIFGRAQHEMQRPQMKQRIQSAYLFNINRRLVKKVSGRHRRMLRFELVHPMPAYTSEYHDYPASDHELGFQKVLRDLSEILHIVEIELHDFLMVQTRGAVVAYIRETFSSHLDHPSSCKQHMLAWRKFQSTHLRLYTFQSRAHRALGTHKLSSAHG